jgi:hypothetical protein
VVVGALSDERPRKNETVGVQINPGKIHLFDAKTEETLLR